MKILKSSSSCEVIIKKSRFVVNAIPVNNHDEAMHALKSVSDPSANHNCWAYRAGDIYRFSDDGEPGGTAGRPILSAIDNLETDNVMIVVTRYFGGIKLGTGGLVRAYSGVTAECLKNAETEEVTEYTDTVFTCPFELTGQVYSVLNKFSIKEKEEDYSGDGIVFRIKVPKNEFSEFCKTLRDSSGGRINPSLMT